VHIWRQNWRHRNAVGKNSNFVVEYCCFNGEAFPRFDFKANFQYGRHALSYVLVQVIVNVPLVRVKLLRAINGNPDSYSYSYSCLCERSLKLEKIKSTQLGAGQSLNLHGRFTGKFLWLRHWSAGHWRSVGKCLRLFWHMSVSERSVWNHEKHHFDDEESSLSVKYC